MEEPGEQCNVVFALIVTEPRPLSVCVGGGAQSTHRVATADSGVHSIMMEKLAQAGEGRGCTPTPFHYIYHHVQSCSVRFI
jgi:hypothetical protein